MKSSSEPGRLLILVPSASRGGNEEYALTIGAAGVRRGYAVWAAFPQGGAMASVGEDFRRTGVKCLDSDISEEEKPHLQIVRDQCRILRILAILHKVNPDVVHMALPWPSYGFGLLVGCALLRVPAVVVFQLAPRPIPVTRWRRLACRWARRRRQQWIAISRNNQRLLCESYGVDAADIRVIYNGARRVVAGPSDDADREVERRSVRRELGVPENARLLITVGRLHSQKGHADLIRGASDILETDPDVQFVWVGDGPLREELTRDLRKSGVEGAVHLLGHRTDVRRLLRAADLFVFPTHFEGGQSFALAEAMNERIPIVSSSASGIPEVIEHGVHGLLFQPGNTAELVDAVRWAIRNPDAMGRMAEAALERGNEFSGERMVEQTFSVLDRMRTLRGP